MSVAMQSETLNTENITQFIARIEIPDAPLLDVPDPEPGWATRHPDRALAFLYVFPRPCAALDELMQL